MIRRVVLATGSSTFIFPTTKEQLKELLPVFFKLVNGSISAKPLSQNVFSNFMKMSFGAAVIGFVVGRGKDNIEDYFAHAEVDAETWLRTSCAHEN